MLRSFKLGYQGSNLDKQNQNLLCYRYTITQSFTHSLVWECKNRDFKKKPKLFFKLFYSLSSFSFKDLIRSIASATTSHIIVIKEPGFAVL